MTGISAFIVCKNEIAAMPRCLESVAWCDEVVVVDSGSTDGTLELCRARGCRVFERAWNGYVEQKAFALAQCTQPWILNLDADEEVSPELRDEIQGLLRCDAASPLAEDGFELIRVVFYLGRWWRKGGWHPEWRLRLARRDRVTWHGEEPHEHARVAGPVRRLRGELRHFTYRDIADQVRRLNTHSTQAAMALHRRGRSARTRDWIFRPVARFFRFYVLRKGWREGWPGFVAAGMEAFYAFLKYLKLAEISLTRR